MITFVDWHKHNATLDWLGMPPVSLSAVDCRQQQKLPVSALYRLHTLYTLYTHTYRSEHVRAFLVHSTLSPESKCKVSLQCISAQCVKVEPKISQQKHLKYFNSLTDCWMYMYMTLVSRKYGSHLHTHTLRQ